jgi:hypothetical protein
MSSPSDTRKKAWHEFHQFATFCLTPHTPSKVVADKDFAKVLAAFKEPEKSYTDQAALEKWNGVVSQVEKARILKDFFEGLDSRERDSFRKVLKEIKRGPGEGPMDLFLLATAKGRGVLGGHEEKIIPFTCIFDEEGFDYKAYGEGFNMMEEAFNKYAT